MEIEKERGISVTSSVLQFQYDGYLHQYSGYTGDIRDFLGKILIVSSLWRPIQAVMVIDGSKGVEAQTRKLFKVCVMRHIPIFTFINKMDREAMDTFELLDDIEKELGIATCPINWPIGSGKEFRGVFDRNSRELEIFSDTKKGTSIGEVEKVSIDSEEAKSIVSEAQFAQLEEEIELLDGASAEFDQEMVSKGELSPVFFGSALTNFGVETFLQHFLKMTTSPLPRMSDKGLIDPMKEEDFSAFVFKIQATLSGTFYDSITANTTVTFGFHSKSIFCDGFKCGIREGIRDTNLSCIFLIYPYTDICFWQCDRDDCFKNSVHLSFMEHATFIGKSDTKSGYGNLYDYLHDL